MLLNCDWLISVPLIPSQTAVQKSLTTVQNTRIFFSKYLLWKQHGNPNFITNYNCMDIHTMDLVMQSQISWYGFHYFFQRKSATTVQFCKILWLMLIWLVIKHWDLTLINLLKGRFPLGGIFHAERNFSLSFLIRPTREITRQRKIPLRAENST